MGPTILTNEHFEDMVRDCAMAELSLGCCAML